ncbi:MAG: hypothetical protein H6706_19865 [Myxococcales bacterium]|nr:hypothetical protein [Myxococcales bacterium]
MYDGGGSFSPPGVGYRRDGDIKVLPDGASLEALYMEWLHGKAPGEASYFVYFDTTEAEEFVILSRMRYMKDVCIPGACAACAGIVLNNVGPFRNVLGAPLPLSLLKTISQLEWASYHVSMPYQARRGWLCRLLSQWPWWL